MEQIIQIPLTALRESPFNPRKAYDEGDLLELAESIQLQGVMQPIVVRPLPDAQTDVMLQYEIVFGHRRYRAAGLAGLEAVPAIVRDMTDQQAAIAQTHENSKRRDVTVVEEADSFAHLQLAHHMSADDIAAEVGKSRAYVYQRLKLAKGCPELREACLQHGMPAETAIEVARLPKPELQRLALQRLRVRDTVDGFPAEETRWLSSREAKRTLRSMFDIKISAAPFDSTDKKLLKTVGACTTCPKRAGNDADLRDVLDEDVCLDGDCYTLKKGAWEQQHTAAARKAGHKVIDGDAAKELMPFGSYYIKDHTKLASRQLDDPKGGDDTIPLREVLAQMGDAAPKLTIIRDPHTGEFHDCITDEELEQVEAWVMKARGETRPDFKLTSGPDEGAELPDARVDLRDNWQEISLAIYRKVIAGPRTTAELKRLISREAELGDVPSARVLMLFGLPGDLVERDAFMDAIDQLNGNQLAALLIIMAMEEGSGWPGATTLHDRELMCQAYGIDPEDPNAEPAPTPSTAARAQKGAADGSGDDASAAPAPAKAKKAKAKVKRVDPALAAEIQAALDLPGEDPPADAGKEQTDDAGVTAGEVPAERSEQSQEGVTA
jgi:ParB/RepB/Spo0J family partition protein